MAYANSLKTEMVEAISNTLEKGTDMTYDFMSDTLKIAKDNLEMKKMVVFYSIDY